jgi:prevent-host-death family protein
MMKQTSRPVNNVISALTARTQLGQILRRATRNNERFVVDRRGEPSVVIMSIKDYVDTMAPAPRWLKDIQASSRRRGTNRLTMKQIDAEIAKVRRQENGNTKQSSR